MGARLLRKPPGRGDKAAPTKAAGCPQPGDTSLPPPIPRACRGCFPPAHRTGTLTWVLAALAPGKFIFGLSLESRAWPRLRAKRSHFLPLTASLLYHKLSRFIFFSTRKGCSHRCLHQHWHRLPLGHQATGPLDHGATGPPHLCPSPKDPAFALCIKHTEVSANPFLPATEP